MIEENIQELEKILPERFRKLGTLSFDRWDSSGKLYQLKGSKNYTLKVIDCGTNRKEYQNAMHELLVMERLKKNSGAVQLLDYEVIEKGTGKAIDCGTSEERYQNIMRTLAIMERFGESESVVDQLDDEIDDSIEKLVCMLMPTYKLASENWETSEPCEWELLIFGAALCRVLNRCLSDGVMYPDVKPANIYQDDTGELRLGNFSKALLWEEVGKIHCEMETPAYAAPETYQKGECSERSLICSVGLVLYIPLNGKRLPFGNDLWTRLQGTPVPPPTNASLMVAEYLQKLCNPKPAQRPEHLYEVEEKLEELSSLQMNTDLPCLSSELLCGMSWKQYELEKQPEVKKDKKTLVPDMEDEQTLHNKMNKEQKYFIEDRKEKYHSHRMYAVCPDFLKLDMLDLKTREAYKKIFGKKLKQLTCYSEDITIDRVEFSAVAPKILFKGDYSILHLMMYEAAFRKEVDALLKEADVSMQETKSGVMQVQREKTVRVVLSSPDAEVLDDEDSRVWQGGYLDFSFSVQIPETYSKRQVLFRAQVYIDGVLATRLTFTAECVSPLQQKLDVLREDVLSAFISYASEDRAWVLTAVEGMKKARSDLDVFVDVEKLRSGEDWRKRLYAEIDRRDILYLFWSCAASRSLWVDREWRYAKDTKGIDAVEPVPLDPPSVCPPPKELEDKHFNESALYIIQASKHDRT